MQGLRGISVFPHYNILTTPEFCTGLQDSALPDCGELEKTIILVGQGGLSLTPLCDDCHRVTEIIGNFQITQNIKLGGSGGRHFTFLHNLDQGLTLSYTTSLSSPLVHYYY